MPGNGVYGVKLSRLRLQLIEGFKECFNAIIGQLSLSYRIRVDCLSERDQLV